MASCIHPTLFPFIGDRFVVIGSVMITYEPCVARAGAGLAVPELLRHVALPCPVRLFVRLFGCSLKPSRSR